MKSKILVTLIGLFLLTQVSSVSAKVRTILPSLIIEESTYVVTIKNFNSKKDPFKAELRIDGAVIPLESKLRADKKRVDITFPDLVTNSNREVYGLLTLTGKGNEESQLVIIANKMFVDSTGPQGNSGPQGPTGLTGPQGVAGANGTNGTNGSQGPRGLQGIAGVNGENGRGISDAKVNSDGILLIKYTDGVIDALGVVKGDVGEAGEDGATGPQGPAGPKGDTGSSILDQYITIIDGKVTISGLKNCRSIKSDENGSLYCQSNNDRDDD
tara:strand:+ start:4587 stop:5396 length:810 start_codon:yes stop_codon:yes gene_type:complete